MKCNWCGEGTGNNYTRDRKTGIIFYYYCKKCVGNFTINPFKLKGMIKMTEEKNEKQPKECKICRHCGYIPDYDDFYCWSIEGLCTEIIEYCKENRCYEPDINKLDVIEILGRKYKKIDE